MIFLEGILLGLIPALMAGPLTIALMYTSIEKGLAVGLSLGFGIWISDLLYILAVYFGFNYLMDLAGVSSFNWSVGAIGSAILIAIGVGILLKKERDLSMKKTTGAKDLTQGFTQGFAINTFNPVAVIFWTSVMGAVIIDRQWGHYEAALFFGGTMFSVVVSDLLKIVLAEWLKKWLNPSRWKAASKISGYLFILFGIALLVRIAIGL